MAKAFKLPDVGEGLHEAELLRWLVKEGDYVREDQPIMEVQTDKAAVEITSPTTAKVAKLNGKVGDILHVGSVVVEFDDGKAATVPGEQTAELAVAAAAPDHCTPRAEAGVAAAAATAPVTVPAGRRALASPATRKLAREMGIDINQVPGTGRAGRVTAADLRNFAASSAQAPTLALVPGRAAAPPAPDRPAPVPAAAAAGDERLPLKGIRKVIADRMVKSVYTAPHVSVVDEVDMTELSAFRARARELAEKKGIRLSFMPFIFKALTTTLKEHPYSNAQIDDEKQEIVLRKQYHIAFALDTEAGLLVPVVRDVDKKSVFQIAAEMQDLIERGRAGKLQPDELKGSTFTVSNQGSVGGLFFTPVINHPEVAILGVGSTQERPVVKDGQITVAPMMYLALSFDHRLIDGAPAARFLNRVKELLGNPTLLMMEAM
ncbi:MAG TPA: dihydrolipoamide acetyltransferase family protein [Symbiobacteriaceae bacterium]|nr:dihydrolipoamide acetyltransferase family protein [Symbiobacteriaceae bacterium]